MAVCGRAPWRSHPLVFGCGVGCGVWGVGCGVCWAGQIRYAFSVPSDAALAWLGQVPVRAWVSPGAGLAYWEALLTARGLAVIPFDNMSWFPEAMQHMPVLPASVEVLERPLAGLVEAFVGHCAAQPGPPPAPQLWALAEQPACTWEETALLLAWPDECETSDFGLQCLRGFQGRWLVHVGELVGQTCSANPWGQSTSQRCQLELFRTFRQVASHPLPNWPGHRDALTVWHRARDAVDCDGAAFVYTPSLPMAGPASPSALEHSKEA